jgi:UDP-N-acetylglucosamine--N-acetylmuramyl-(pentapeptide) pyrophosphoryl-undecaprenol N-acetylglucosamine transferase
VVLFAGGGTGGHIAPNVAVIERLREMGSPLRPHLLVSDRTVDATMAQRLDLPWTAVPARPLALHPLRLWPFFKAYRLSMRLVGEVIARTGAKAMVATGGFVSGPSVHAARQAGLAVAMVNLDAVPGRANRLAVRQATDVFSAYPDTGLRRAREIGLPLRRAALTSTTPAKARWELGLRPDLETLIVTAGSQGARTINQLMIELASRTAARQALAGWQIIHMTGDAPGERDAVAEAYRAAGASSVAESWANHVPTLFLPYPYHKDQHQRFNAEPLVNRGGALMARDLIDPIANAAQLQGPLLELVNNATRRERMAALLRDSAPGDGAAVVARWLVTTIGRG